MPTIPSTLVLTPVSRHPLVLMHDTVAAVEALRADLSGFNQGCATPADKPRVSIIVVTYNGLTFTRLCLISLLENTAPEGLEIIVVDNHSLDGTPIFLRALEERVAHLRVIRNPSNRGFAAANNQGLAEARGDFLVLLNNDTIVPAGWLDRLLSHLDDPSIGLIGGVTNRIGNEAEITTNYQTYGEMLQFADQHMRRHEGESWDIPTLCMYCLAMRRDTFERLGPVDERFEIGMLEDDDYSMRAHQAGLRVVCAEDVFVHHFGGAAFGALVPSGEYGRLIDSNRRRFEEKWGQPWRPYQRRRSAPYLKSVERIHAIARDAIPAGATVLVVSRGDQYLLEVDAYRARHFPQDESGGYAGCYPADSAEAIAHLDGLRRKGAEYLLFPSTAFWWLDHYSGFRDHLEEKGPRIWADGDCVVFKL